MDFRDRHLNTVQRVESLSNLMEFYRRIIVVSNRLPVNIEDKGKPKDENVKDYNRWDFKMSSGGLVAGLEGVKKKMPFLWLGWTGKWFPGKDCC
jgi:trehalose-6-phosphate synthase